MRNLIPNWLMAFALFYVLLQIITLELPEDERGNDKPPRLLSEHLEHINQIYAVDTTQNISYTDQTKQESVVCLAKNAYFEARNQSVLSQIAVSQVVMNRVKSPDYPNTVCGVVYEAQLSNWYKVKMDKEVPIKNKCQFSWYCDGKSDEPESNTSWDESVYLSLLIYSEELTIDVTEGALWYHATYVSPSWAEHYEKTVRINDHIFYR